ncbi:hypothetical protein EFO61_00800 [Lacticaseibacillus rhamnosus]|nr:Alpha-galactosidase [Lacticaseibacillus rhamnosus LOCK900]ARD33189.1 hypothetical protein BVH57_12830 [Lacticaseibacillus rhamnosus]EHJ36109.1 hypothetical protein HMPREF0541_00093 [Lacticaseibacillus rhamnosus ATCC 21052]MCT3145344.1 hypothetical protein [Lacticaseibacillus rhamnosus]MCT3153849.1 hypothetical protein [Lacticaseibacillus rhamnosus]
MRVSSSRAPALNRAGSRSIITRSPAQGPACKDLGRNGQSATITPKAAYTPVPNRAGSRSHKEELVHDCSNAFLSVVSTETLRSLLGY